MKPTNGFAPLFRGIPRKTQNTRKFSTSRNNQENHGNTLFWNSVIFSFYSVMFPRVQARAKPEAESKPSACELCFPGEDIRSMTKVEWQETNKDATLPGGAVLIRYGPAVSDVFQTGIKTGSLTRISGPVPPGRSCTVPRGDPFPCPGSDRVPVRRRDARWHLRETACR